MVLLNISQIVLYCRYTGMPYKSAQHYRDLKHCGYVVAYWTIAFSLKFTTAFIDKINTVSIDTPNDS